MQISIDPDTRNLVGVDGAIPRTYAEIQQIKPPCPRCGTRVSVISYPAESFAGSGPTQLYQFSRHEFRCTCFSGSAE